MIGLDHQGQVAGTVYLFTNPQLYDRENTEPSHCDLYFYAGLIYKNIQNLLIIVNVSASPLSYRLKIILVTIAGELLTIPK